MRRSGKPQVQCSKCGNLMRLDDKDELRRGVYKYWFACDRCSVYCTLDGSTGEMSWDYEIVKEDDLPF